MTLDLEHETENSRKESNSRKVQNSVQLPDEITRELEALSKVDDDRLNRIAKLEKLRRGEEILPDLPDGEDEVREEEENKNKQIIQPESTESSVEGKNCFSDLFLSKIKALCFERLRLVSY